MKMTLWEPSAPSVDPRYKLSSKSLVLVSHSLAGSWSMADSPERESGSGGNICARLLSIAGRNRLKVS